MFSPPDETILRSERKMKVVHLKNDKFPLKIYNFYPVTCSSKFLSFRYKTQTQGMRVTGLYATKQNHQKQ